MDLSKSSMAPKSKGSRNDDLKQEDILQAVVFADSFNTKFMPITKEKPRVFFKEHICFSSMRNTNSVLTWDDAVC